MDIVQDFYSKPQMGGALKASSRRSDSFGRESIPVFKGSRMGGVAGGVADAVRLAGGQAVNNYVRDNPKPDQKRKYHAGANAFRERYSDSASGIIAKAMGDGGGGEGPSTPKKEKKKSSKHKRSKISSFLGDESF
jgi:hypothetical protein